MIEIKSYASGSSGNMYVLSNDRTRLLVECGLPYRQLQRMLDYDMGFDGVLVSHEHKDHAKAVKELAHRGKHIYMSAGTASALGISQYEKLKSLAPVQIGTMMITPFDSQHDCAEPLGFVIADADDKVLFTTDTYYIKYKFNGITKLMVECNHSYTQLDTNIANGTLPKSLAKRLVKSHMSIETLCQYLRDTDISSVSEIWLLHLSAKNSDAEVFKKIIATQTGVPVYVA